MKLLLWSSLLLQTAFTALLLASFLLTLQGSGLSPTQTQKGVSFLWKWKRLCQKRDWKDIYHPNCSQFKQESAFAIVTFRNTFRCFPPKSAFAILTFRDNFNKFFQCFTWQRGQDQMLGNSIYVSASLNPYKPRSYAGKRNLRICQLEHSLQATVVCFCF
jgi:hypothetical protein